MKERPILMCGDMVRATLEGRKTETRRVVDRDLADRLEDGWGTEEQWIETDETPQGGLPVSRFCPHGSVGDRLWVRETFCMTGGIGVPGSETVWYRADGDRVVATWRPSIFMPRWASRLTLEIVGVRVERVQEITSQAALAEGVRLPVMADGSWAMRITGKYPPCNYAGTNRNALVSEYASLWDTLNAKRGFPWARNPWVWVVRFKRLASLPVAGAEI